MKKLILLFIILFYPIVSFANIDERKTDVYFANGILTEEADAKDNAEKILAPAIEKLYGTKTEMEKYIGKVGYAYNETHGFTYDAIETALQKLGGQAVLDWFIDTSHARDLSAQIEKYQDSIKDGHKVLVIAHSQGNLFTSDAWWGLKEWMRDYFEVISIASPGMYPVRPSSNYDTPLISWNNDTVAYLGVFNSSLADNNVRKVSWTRIEGQQGVEKPKHNYVYKNQVGTVYKNTWIAVEDGTDNNVHAFTFYMGEALKEGDEKKPNYNEEYINPFDGNVLQTDTAKSKILNAIGAKITFLQKVKSQYKPKNIGCSCSEKYVKLTHKFDPANMPSPSTEKTQDYSEGDETGKIYQIDAKYIRGHFSGFSINDSEEDGVCSELKDEETSLLGQVIGFDEKLETKDGVVEITLEWDKQELDFDLSVAWDAGEVDLKDICKPMEHFHIKSEMKILPGTYQVFINPKDASDEIFKDPSIYPIKVSLVTRTPGASDKMEFVIKNSTQISLGHVSDIKVYREGEDDKDEGDDDNADDDLDSDSTTTSIPSPFFIVPQVAPECPPVTLTPSPVPPKPIQFSHGSSGGYSFYGGGGGGGGNYVGGGSGGSSSTGSSFTIQQDPSCGGDLSCLPKPTDATNSANNNNNGNSDSPEDAYAPVDPIVGGTPTRDLAEEDSCEGGLSCGCIPCEYEIIPYLKQIYFGPLRNANFSIYSLDGYISSTALYEGTTSKGETLYDAGELDVPQGILNILQDDKLYVIKAEGGEDIDSDDNFIIDITPTKNLGKVYALASGKDIKYTGLKINILTTLTFKLVQEMIADGNSSQENYGLYRRLCA